MITICKSKKSIDLHYTIKTSFCKEILVIQHGNQLSFREQYPGECHYFIQTDHLLLQQSNNC